MGDIHISMHMLVIIYNVYYPGLLQVLQGVLRWKMIQLNHLQRYQLSKDLCLMTLHVLEQMRMKHWGRFLKRHKSDTSRSRCILHPLDYKLVDGQKVEYSLNELVQCCT